MKLRIKHLRDNIWQAYSTVETVGEEDSEQAPISVRFAVDDCTALFLRGWIWSAPAEEDSIWLLRSWLEENESEILDLAGIGPS